MVFLSVLVFFHGLEFGYWMCSKFPRRLVRLETVPKPFPEDGFAPQSRSYLALSRPLGRPDVHDDARLLVVVHLCVMDLRRSFVYHIHCRVTNTRHTLSHVGIQCQNYSLKGTSIRRVRSLIDSKATHAHPYPNHDHIHPMVSNPTSSLVPFRKV
ncbi:hypothetical protein CC80DRAFT_131771 [Byssothecium circinans]|uniref:Secreted protein n=1 Tax=Byssothecium circinans TaxID=147558 RepID=A0A6A5TN74_9PLEO|nr:hypothetical protein CC80DRAFT_131771 [Byssothecium circinans]